MPRVFVSSIMEGYAEYREAARRGIVSAGAAPVLVEDQPARPDTPRNACLDAVSTSDVLIALVGPRGGYEAPSGKLVVEEEFEEARRLGKPTLVFLQRCDRDPSASSLARRLSDYVSGLYRQEFSGPEELERLVKQSLELLMPTLTRPERDSGVIQERLQLLEQVRREDPWLRLALGPAVEDIAIDPLLFEEVEFQESVLRIAHETRFFSYQRGGKQPRVLVDGLAVVEIADGHHATTAKLEIDSSGLVSLEMKIGGYHESGWTERALSDLFEIVVEDLDATFRAELAFATRLLDLVDPHGRYAALLYNAALVGIGQRSIVDARARSNSYTARMHEVGSLAAYDAPRRLTRQALRVSSDEEVRRVISLLRRRLETANPYS